MIQPHSTDTDVEKAAKQALDIIEKTLSKLSKAKTYNYGGHTLQVGEYGVCPVCATPIAEAQAAQAALETAVAANEDETVRAHIQLAADFFRLEAEEAVLRAELHNGHGTEDILNRLLGYQFARGIHDDYHHSHHKGEE